MTTIQQDIQAARIYFAIGQLDYFPQVGNSEEVSKQIQKSLQGVLKLLDYPIDPIFDNEGEPVIKWKNPNFDYGEYIYDKDYFTDLK